jgi:hypothetical protein
MSFELNYSKFENITYAFYTFFCASTISVNKSLCIPDTFEKKNQNSNNYRIYWDGF